MPKVVWKLLSTRQAIIYRAVELQNGISTLLNADNLRVLHIILARTLVELMVFVGYLSEELSIATKNENLGAIDKAIQSSNFSTRWEDMPAEAKAKNILTLLEKFDRKIMKEEKELPVTDMHAILSEFTHPNWVGTAGFFGFIDKQTAVQHFSVVHRDRAGILGNICGGCMCLLFIERACSESMFRKILPSQNRVYFAKRRDHMLWNGDDTQLCSPMPTPAPYRSRRCRCTAVRTRFSRCRV